MLRVAYTARFQREVKRLKKKQVDLDQLKNLIDLVAQNTPEALEELRRRHNGVRAQLSACFRLQPSIFPEKRRYLPQSGHCFVVGDVLI